MLGALEDVRFSDVRVRIYRQASAWASDVIFKIDFRTSSLCEYSYSRTCLPFFLFTDIPPRWSSLVYKGPQNKTISGDPLPPHLSSMSFLSHLNPAPSFPSYTGPYKVGSTDVEIPVAELPSPSPAPDPTLATVSFRIFYPCETPPKPPHSVHWLPDPQQEYLGAYLRFLGASRRLSGFLRSLSSMPSYIKILNY